MPANANAQRPKRPLQTFNDEEPIRPAPPKPEPVFGVTVEPEPIRPQDRRASPSQPDAPRAKLGFLPFLSLLARPAPPPPTAAPQPVVTIAVPKDSFFNKLKMGLLCSVIVTALMNLLYIKRIVIWLCAVVLWVFGGKAELPKGEHGDGGGFFDKVKQQVSKTIDKAKETGIHLKEEVAERTGKAKETVGHAKEMVVERVKDAKEEVAERAEKAKEAVVEKIDDIKEDVQGKIAAARAMPQQIQEARAKAAEAARQRQRILAKQRQRALVRQRNEIAKRGLDIYLANGLQQVQQENRANFQRMETQFNASVGRR